MQSRRVSPPTVSFATTRTRRSSAAEARVGRVGTGCSARRARTHQATTSALSTMNTARPTHRPPSTAASTITAKYARLASTNRNASASLRSGLIMYRKLQDVDRRVHDDPHYVHEVPVDPGDLDAVVRSRRVVAAEGAHGRREQQQQPDGDVSPVQAGEAVEDRRERAVLGREADPGVL